MTKTRVIPAIMPDTKDDITAEITRLDPAPPYVQLDIMDGVFVPGMSWPYRHEGQFEELEHMAGAAALAGYQGVTFEVHLMVASADEIGELFAHAGAHRIIAHIESFADTEHARATFASWRQAGVQEIGISLLLQTPIERIDPLLSARDVDLVQVMSIAEIGEQGHAFDQQAIDHIRALRAAYSSMRISADGGIKAENIASVFAAGADHVAAGSALWESDDPSDALEQLQTKAQDALVRE